MSVSEKAVYTPIEVGFTDAPSFNEASRVALWELAGEVAFGDPLFQRLTAETALKHLKENLLLLDDVAPLQFHPNTFWLLVAMADLEAPRLQRLARRKALEEGWIGNWERWMIRVLVGRFKPALGRLSSPLRRKVSEAAAEGAPEAEKAS